jgi:DNA segregation ATPase FtsK/SpoIIIE, S-DNA-T family
VPIGRLGATKRQALDLGKGTAQHGLIAGKTGSGKSTLLHAIITNLGLTYSPDEIELYLIDFKKGVEFKPYAEYAMPHARVVAIESEREFGLSVLQRLDAELRSRGEKFRIAGVTDINGYRNENPGERMPRILLIVDEFQEFFVEEDKMAQEAALLLDRLVRQGRAFGLHVLLGSQTLGGAYSLARATIDQMAVRIALQCSEADAHLILSKENSAARLLSRPGEAIYNDANGLVEGNDIFQVVWLSDDRREAALKMLDERAKGTERRLPLVFEGNAPAELDRNNLLTAMLKTDSWPSRPRAFSAWLGDAIAIKDPTAAVFRPQSGSHLLMIGQQEDAALPIFASAILSLAAQHRPDDPSDPLAGRFHILDGTAPDDNNANFLTNLVDGLPHPVKVLDPWSVAPTFAELAELIAARHARTTDDRSTHYLIIHGVHRFRDLRRPDDEYSFGRGGTITPAQHLTTILRDGPSVGVHCLMWCDTLVNVNRAFDRTMLRECTQRVLFQMSATDSSHLIDSPLAARLGRNRALFSREEQEQPEKFRPYGFPSREWLTWAKAQLAKRARSPKPEPEVAQP